MSVGNKNLFLRSSEISQSHGACVYDMALTGSSLVTFSADKEYQGLVSRNPAPRFYMPLKGV